MDTFWITIIIGAALGTYVVRAAPLLWRPLSHVGDRYVHLLTYISFAIAAGIVSKALVVADARIAIDSDVAIKAAALAVALVIQRWVKNVPVALFAGIGVAVLIKWFVG